MAALSRSISRRLGLLIDRQGRVFMLLVGDTTSVLIPELPRAREGAGRLRGLRLLLTRLTADAVNRPQELLTQEDLMDLLFLRLDGIAALGVDLWGEPTRLQRAHLLPPNPDKRTYLLHPPSRWDAVDGDLVAEAEALEAEFTRTQLSAQVSAAPPREGSGPVLCQTRKASFYEGGLASSGLPPESKRCLTKYHAKPDHFPPESRAILVSVSTKPKAEQESALHELAELADTAGVHVAGTLMQRVQALNPHFILGKGKLAELEVLALQGNAGLIVFDGELSPAQLRNLTEVTERRVLDRTQIILDIFARRASSKAGKFQVELAQLQYMLPRLAHKAAGALDRLAGGIGGRGPGETRLETDRRRLRDRVARIKDALKDLRRQRAYARARRAKGQVPVASLVGYTNAGKSTLLNALTGSGVLAEDRLFATLDPTTRRLRFPEERELILTDTVGFIRSLPRELVEAFRATLEELEEADLLLHVADASHPEMDKQLHAVEDILIQLELNDTPRLLLLNKADALDEEARAALAERHPEALLISARTGEGLAELSAALVSRIAKGIDRRVAKSIAHGIDGRIDLERAL